MYSRILQQLYVNGLNGTNNDVSSKMKCIGYWSCHISQHNLWTQKVNHKHKLRLAMNCYIFLKMLRLRATFCSYDYSGYGQSSGKVLSSLLIFLLLSSKLFTDVNVFTNIRELV
jgi:hypothetical protein